MPQRPGNPVNPVPSDLRSNPVKGPAQWPNHQPEEDNLQPHEALSSLYESSMQGNAEGGNGELFGPT